MSNLIQIAAYPIFRQPTFYEKLPEHPTIKKHIGHVSFLQAVESKAGKNNEPDEFVYVIKGSKGDGNLTVKRNSTDDGKVTIHSATLLLFLDGETKEIVLDLEPIR